MHKNLLIQFIESKNPKNQGHYDLLKEIFDQRFYYYGAHFKSPFEKKISPKDKLINNTLGVIKSIYIKIMGFQKKKKKPTILSNTYFNIDEHFLNSFNINVSRPPWNYNQSKNNLFDYELFKMSENLNYCIKNKNLSYLISDEFINEINLYKNEIKKHVINNNIVSLFVSNDICFFEKLYISIFKELNIPSFIFVHGLQFWLNEMDFTRSDYLVVWGSLSKQDFVKKGMPASKVIISGHPSYNINEKPNLKFDFDNILVLGKSIPGSKPSDDYTLSDRSNSILYLFYIQDCLTRLGVKKVRFRPHPSENSKWYTDNIDNDFFIIDNMDIKKSLNESSLVIGPTSTVLFEALLLGVNYVVFEPLNQYNKSFDGYNIPTLYNGDNPKVPVANNVLELLEILKSKKSVDISVLDELSNSKFKVDTIYEIIMNQLKT